MQSDKHKFLIRFFHNGHHLLLIHTTTNIMLEGADLKLSPYLLLALNISSDFF